MSLYPTINSGYGYTPNSYTEYVNGEYNSDEEAEYVNDEYDEEAEYVNGEHPPSYDSVIELSYDCDIIQEDTTLHNIAKSAITHDNAQLFISILNENPSLLTVLNENSSSVIELLYVYSFKDDDNSNTVFINDSTPYRYRHYVIVYTLQTVLRIIKENSEMLHSFREIFDESLKECILDQYIEPTTKSSHYTTLSLIDDIYNEL